MREAMKSRGFDQERIVVLKQDITESRHRSREGGEDDQHSRADVVLHGPKGLVLVR
jgi:hypothetical protein